MTMEGYSLTLYYSKEMDTSKRFKSQFQLSRLYKIFFFSYFFRKGDDTSSPI